MPAAIAEAPSTGIGKLLAENGFSVPTHQGNYRWKEDEVKQLFDDIIEAIARSDDSYFLGLMVFMQSSDGSSIVLDGQQRLATSLMILAAVRTWLSQFTEYKEDARQIQERFIGLKELGETVVQPRLHMNSANHARWIHRRLARGALQARKTPRFHTTRRRRPYEMKTWQASNSKSIIILATTPQ